MKANSNSNIEREIRTFQAAEIRVADTEDTTSRTIEGYAFLYNSPTDMGWYTETILPGAADGILQHSDIRALLNHNPNDLLARSKKGQGTLSLELDSRGLRFSFQCPKSRTDIIEMLERGDLDQCSFAFTIDEQRWIEKEGAPELREIVRFKELYDITLATYPAYPDTTVALRCREEALGSTTSSSDQETRRRTYYLQRMEIALL